MHLILHRDLNRVLESINTCMHWQLLKPYIQHFTVITWGNNVILFFASLGHRILPFSLIRDFFPGTKWSTISFSFYEIDLNQFVWIKWKLYHCFIGQYKIHTLMYSVKYLHHTDIITQHGKETLDFMFTVLFTEYYQSCLERWKKQNSLPFTN